MSSNESHREQRNARPRRRPERVAVEALETRQLLTYSPFGYSLPDLTVSGYAAPAAAWGGPLSINVNVQNLGASSLIEPTNLAPGATSTADAPATTVDVFASSRPNGRNGLIKVDTIVIPAIKQNSDFQADRVITLPSQPAGFPGNGGKIYLSLVVNNSRAINETRTNNNTFRVPTAVKIAAPLPELKVVAFDIPSTLVPGQVISPTIRIANFGAGNPNLQGPVTVQLVASLNKTFGPGDSVVASYVIDSLPGISAVPTEASVLADASVNPPININTTTLSPVKLPTTPNRYFFGIVIDPAGTIQQVTPQNSRIKAVVPVGPPNAFLPPRSLLVNTGGVVPIFPNAPSKLVDPLTGAPGNFPTLFPGPITPIFVTNSVSKASKGKLRG